MAHGPEHATLTPRDLDLSEDEFPELESDLEDDVGVIEEDAREVTEDGLTIKYRIHFDTESTHNGQPRVTSRCASFSHYTSTQCSDKMRT